MKTFAPGRSDHTKLEPPMTKPTPGEQVDAAEDRRKELIARAIAAVAGEEESAELMEDYAERAEREPRLSDYELSLLRRASNSNARSR